MLGTKPCPFGSTFDWRPFGLWGWLCCLCCPHHVALPSASEWWSWNESADSIPIPLQSLQWAWLLLGFVLYRAEGLDCPCAHHFPGFSSRSNPPTGRIHHLLFACCYPCEALGKRCRKLFGLLFEHGAGVLPLDCIVPGGWQRQEHPKCHWHYSHDFGPPHGWGDGYVGSSSSLQEALSWEDVWHVLVSS